MVKTLTSNEGGAPSSCRAKQTGGQEGAGHGAAPLPQAMSVRPLLPPGAEGLQGLPRAKPISRAQNSLKVPRGDPNLFFSGKLGSAALGKLLLMPDGPGGEPGPPVPLVRSGPRGPPVP